MAMFQGNSYNTWYTVSGNKANPALFLIHGLGGDNSMWKFQIDFFADNGFFVIAPDMLAHGKSSHVNSLSLNDWSGQINSLADGLGINRFSIAGVSMGGVIVQHYAAGNENRIGKMIICDSFSDLVSGIDKFMGKSQLIAFPVFRLLGKKTFAKVMASAYKKDFAAEARNYLYKVSLDADFDQLILARKAINGIKVLDKLRLLKIPSLVLVGDKFGEYFIKTNKKTADAIPGSEFHVIKNSMDPSCLIQPDIFNSLVLEFLNK